jgi:hypothetical protein
VGAVYLLLVAQGESTEHLRVQVAEAWEFISNNFSSQNLDHDSSTVGHCMLRPCT